MKHATNRSARRPHAGVFALLVTCLVLAAPYTAVATSLGAEMRGEATAVLRFLATDVTAEISGTAAMDGTLAIDDQRQHIEACGTLSGQGTGDSYTLAASGWVVFDLSGSAADAVRLRGVLRLSATGVSTQDPSGEATGAFVAVLEIAGDFWRIAGTVSGTASGAIVAPEIQYTMQVEASYELGLDGDTTPLLELPTGANAESLISNAWAPEARAAFRTLFEAPAPAGSSSSP
ncbi:hypothetical protein JW848_00050 [Candidatus Bipolaricaulota bacterium]|nr:hypothetical protein [Candidatus Bipolaricaulota bacterium]